MATRHLVCAWLSVGDADKFSSSCLYFCNKSGEVWTLPYAMKKDFEKPVKYKPRNACLERV